MEQSTARERKLISVSLGRRSTGGDWIVTETVEVMGLRTVCPQIYITKEIDGFGTGYSLIHLQSGFTLLRGFPDEEAARYSAGVMAALFPIAEWNVMAEIAVRYRRDKVMHAFYKLPLKIQAWMLMWSFKKGAQ